MGQQVKRPPRQYGTGSIYPDKNNPKRLIGEIIIDGKRHRVSARTKTSVEAQLRALTAKRAVGELGDRKSTVIHSCAPQSWPIGWVGGGVVVRC